MKRFTAHVTKNEVIHDGAVHIISFIVPDDSITCYTAGQYISIFFPDSSTPSGKAYSLSSAPHEPEISITVKRIGEFSNLLCDLQPGDTFTCSSAYGHFNPRTDAPLVGIAGGVGIAPIWSVIKDTLYTHPEANIQLYDSNPLREEIPHLDAIHSLASRSPHFGVTHHVTRDDTAPSSSFQQGRIDVTAIIGRAPASAIFLVCGSVGFVRDTWQMLISHGIDARHIMTETFFE